MKQHHLSTKFLRFYILIGILGFFLITLGGSYMVEKHLEHSLSAALYTEAHNIASNEAVKSNISYVQFPIFRMLYCGSSTVMVKSL